MSNALSDVTKVVRSRIFWLRKRVVIRIVPMHRALKGQDAANLCHAWPRTDTLGRGNQDHGTNRVARRMCRSSVATDNGLALTPTRIHGSPPVWTRTILRHDPRLVKSQRHSSPNQTYLCGSTNMGFLQTQHHRQLFGGFCLYGPVLFHIP